MEGTKWLKRQNDADDDYDLITPVKKRFWRTGKDYDYKIVTMIMMEVRILLRL